ncbi:hypothetical protein [Pseudonocardia sp. ICBG601]|uniref:ABC transporter ATP-binding protein n=1 Tax=Pseudonocardia sp. ICBG601 TaxID=2846759 RepID=UPI001CF6E540|nr:hypothetical protein [Pseudonocardia sp. ICBG601]
MITQRPGGGRRGRRRRARHVRRAPGRGRPRWTSCFAAPRMPYTIGLLGAVPRVDSVERRPLSRCPAARPHRPTCRRAAPFAPRCPVAVDACRTAEPPLRPVPGRDDHAAGLRADR